MSLLLAMLKIKSSLQLKFLTILKTMLRQADNRLEFESAAVSWAK